MPTYDELLQKINRLEDQLVKQIEKDNIMIEESKKAAEFSKHAYRVDHYGFIWVWDIDTKEYRKTNMRILSPELVPNSVTSKTIAPGAVRSEHIADNQILSRHIPDKQISGRHIADDQILSRHILDSQILGKHIADRQIMNYHVSRGAVDSSKIAPGTLDGHDIFLNCNLITFQREEDGWIVAYFGNRGPITGFERDEEGWVYALFGGVPQTVSQ